MLTSQKNSMLGEVFMKGSKFFIREMAFKVMYSELLFEGFLSLTAFRSYCAEPMPYLLRRLLEVRMILEELSSQTIKKSPMLTEAYGRSVYKCPIIGCTRFFRGFATRHKRDEHLKGHERNHRCTEMGCDYVELGFVSKGDLNKHVQLCHDTTAEDFIFPNVRPVSTNKALKDAIDRDDVLAIRDICDAQTVHTIGETGFLLQAVKKKSFNAAMVVMELLGTTSELDHQDKKGRTALHEAVVEVEFESLLQEIFQTDVDFQPKDNHGETPLARALTGGHFHAVRMFLSTDKIDLESCSTSYEPFMIGVVLAAAAGQDDIIQSIFNVSVARVPVSGLSRWISHALKKAAFQNHESTVALILELSQNLGIEKHYRGLLQEGSNYGLETMKKLVMVDPRIQVKGRSSIEELIGAAERGDIATVISLLRKGADINHKLEDLPTALAAATSSNQLSMMKLLLDKGAKVDAQGGNGGIPLGTASSKGHVAAIQLLLENGANPDQGIYPASYEGQNAVIELLLDKGAHINAHGLHGDALNAACYRGHEATVKLLLSHGAGIYARGEIADVAFGAAWSIEQEEYAQLKLQGSGGPNDVGLYSALCVAFKKDHRYLVQLLIEKLEKGAETVERRLGKYSRALGKACAAPKGDLETIQALLQSGADPNYGSFRALQTACARGKQDVVQLLLEHGADVNGRDGNKPTALIKAAVYGHENIVKLLLKQGAEVDAWSAYGCGAGGTALVAACSSLADKSVVQMLLDNGADSNIYVATNTSSVNALSMACLQRENEEVVRMLLESGADVNANSGKALKNASRKGNDAIVQLLLQYGAKEM